MDEKNVNIKEKLLQFIEVQRIKKADFFRRTEIASSAFRGVNLTSELAVGKVTRILREYPELNPLWLLLDEGTMLKPVGLVYDPPPEGKRAKSEIPLISINASEGFVCGKFDSHIHTIKELYSIPKFENRGIDFLFEVEGAFMSSCYNSGDLIGCKLENATTRIKWNEEYLISTTQGELMIKRIKPGATKGVHILISDDKDYNPFEIPSDEIRGIAQVLGAIE